MSSRTGLLQAKLPTAASLAALLAGCATAPASPHVVPWVAHPVQALASAEATAEAAPPCRGSQLAGARGRDMAITGQQLLLQITIWNPSARGCQLQGTPSIQLLTASGAAIPLILEPSWSQLTPIGGSTAPVVLEPRHHGAGVGGGPAQGEATLLVVWSPVSDGGPGCPQAPAVAASTRIEIGGEPLVVDVAAEPRALEAALAPCQGMLGLGAYQATEAAAPRPPTPIRLRGRLELPRRVRAGSVLRYRLVLRNHTGHRVQLTSTRANYLESAVSPSHHYKLVDEFQLNCALAGALDPGESRIFAMELPTRRSSATIRLSLRWSFAAGAPLAISPGPVLSARVTLVGAAGR